MEFCHEFDRKASIKDMIESFGVPHTEVELILVNGKSVDFSYIVAMGDRVGVYPSIGRLKALSLIRLRPKLPCSPGFIVDVNLGRLARYLRMLGFDTRYRNDYDDAYIAEISSRENRVLLTRDRTLLRRKIIVHGCFVRSVQPREQLREVVKRLDLYRAIHPFSRCIRCNGTLHSVAKETIATRLEPKTRQYYDEFRICNDCGQIYWRGSHYQRAMALVKELMQTGDTSDMGKDD